MFDVAFEWHAEPRGTRGSPDREQAVGKGKGCFINTWSRCTMVGESWFLRVRRVVCVSRDDPSGGNEKEKEFGESTAQHSNSGEMRSMLLSVAGRC